ncbi:MAG: carbohydrate ABC transporter permease [Ilumatobacteraceae bacterium]
MAITDDRDVQSSAADEPVAKTVARQDAAAEARRGGGLAAGSVFRLLILAALLAFLGFFVGPGEMVSTLIKVVVAVGLTALLFVGANLMFDQVYDHWTLFNTFIGVAVGAVVFGVLDSNAVFRPLFESRVNVLGLGPFDINGWLWAALGGAALGLVMFLLSAPRQQLARMPLAVVGFAAFGVLLALAFDESVRPSFAWGKLVVCVAVAVAVLCLIQLARRRIASLPLTVLTGVAIGWLIGAWGGGNIGRGNLQGVLLATVVPSTIIGLRIGLAAVPTLSGRRRIEQKARVWIFLLPAMFFVAVGLVVPLIRTIYLSFFDNTGEESVGWVNYESIFTNTNSVNFDSWTDVFTSRITIVAIALVALGVLGGLYGGRKTRQPFERSAASVAPLGIGFFLIAIALLASIRGTIFNNVWWVIVVTGLSTAIGLAVAVLADRSRGEDMAKSLIFLPMAISFVGAGIIWRFVYQARDISQDQTGVLNAVWVWFGQVSTSDTGKWIAVAVLAVIGLALASLVRRGVRTNAATMAGISLGLLVIVAFLIYRFIGPGIGGFIEVNGEVRQNPVLFVQEPPYNNMWLMVILIWIQTGFAMVILSAAIKAVPTELTEAAKIDGATESQVFWRVTVPQIAPTIGVVVTTLIVTVMKVFDIVKVTTNGNFGSEVIANEMYTRAFGNSNIGLGSALAVVLFVSILPVMYVNIRRMRKNAV